MNPAKYAALPLMLAATLVHAGTPQGNVHNPLQAGVGQLPKGEFGRYEGRAVQASKDKVILAVADFGFAPPYPSFEGQRAALIWSFEFLPRKGVTIDQVTVQDNLSGTTVTLSHDGMARSSPSGWLGKTAPAKVSRQTMPWLYVPGKSDVVFTFSIALRGQPAQVLSRTYTLLGRDKARILEQGDAELEQAHAEDSAKPFEVPVCGDDQLQRLTPPDEQIAAHRQFTPPRITYPFDSKPYGPWSPAVSIRVDATGKVLCYAKEPARGDYAYLNGQRRAAIREIAARGYTPFMQNGKAVAAVVSETINEEELPERHIDLPDFRPDQVHLSSQRGVCPFGCPGYDLDIDGNGNVVYRGYGNVAVTGTRRYRIAPAEVAKLVESLRQKDLWSLRPVYDAKVMHAFPRTLRFELGGVSHTIEFAEGRELGMPAAVLEFEQEMDRAANSEQWVHLPADMIKALQAKHVRFNSPAGAATLRNLLENPHQIDEGTVLALLKLGVPVQDPPWPDDSVAGTGSLVALALKFHHAVAADALIDHGALQTRHHPDQNKIDAAFQAAIADGRLALAQKIWNANGPQHRPSLTFDSLTNAVKPVHKQAPVTLLVEQVMRYDQEPSATPMAAWLISLGCDIRATNADGDTLLHKAAGRGDIELLRYLLAQGMSPSTPNARGMPALDDASSEDAALFLLDAGTDLTPVLREDSNFVQKLPIFGWTQVVAWLKAHGH